MQLNKERVLLDSGSLERSVRRMGVEIVEHAQGLEDLVLVGVHTGGVHVAKRIQKSIEVMEGAAPPLGMIDISLYRDDAFLGLPNPIIGESRIPGNTISGKTVALIDDVLFTGRTVRAALNALMDFGRPSRILLAVVVDRGRRELPIRADVVGVSVTTGPDHSVAVELSEMGGADEVALYKRAGGA
jgi:pyrimidine operon attenuation protein/uracil phosphoribosyltransferase